MSSATSSAVPDYAEQHKQWKDAREKLQGHWTVLYLADPNVNAFVTGMCPRRIFVNEGLLTTLDLTDDELALILAHELSHVILGHTDEEAFSLQALLIAIEMIILTLFDPIGLSTVMFDYIINNTRLLIEAGYSREHELEADKLGLELCMKACFQVKDSPRVFEKLHRLETHNNVTSGGWHATHPSSADRYIRLMHIGDNHPDAEQHAKECAAAQQDWAASKKIFSLLRR